MKNALASGFIVLLLGAMVALLFWGYNKLGGQQQNASYSKVFEYEYNRGERRRESIRENTPPPKPPVYGGTSEDRIEKYQGDRYATY